VTELTCLADRPWKSPGPLLHSQMQSPRLITGGLLAGGLTRSQAQCSKRVSRLVHDSVDQRGPTAHDLVLSSTCVCRAECYMGNPGMMRPFTRCL